MSTFEIIKQQLNYAKKEYNEVKKKLEDGGKNLNELEEKLERKEWGDDEELKELWKERRSRLIKEKEIWEAEKKRCGNLVEEWGKALREVSRGEVRQVPTIYAKTKITDAFPEGLPYIKPKSLVTSPGLKWQYQLDPNLKTILQEETEKHHYHFCNGENDKINRPIYHFFLRCWHWKIQECIGISSNINQMFELFKGFGAKEKNSKCLAVGIRMFWQLFPDSEDFGRFILTYEAPTPWEVLQLIAKYEKKDLKQISVILVVDGLQNFITTLDDGLNQDSAFCEILAEIGGLAMSNNIFLIPCCTATISRTLRSPLKSTGRLRINLPVISLQPPTTLQNNIFTPVFQQDNHIIKLLVDDCGGHGRALEVLAETLKDKNINECNVDNLMHQLYSNLICRYEDAFNITALEAQTIALLILTRKRLDQNECVPNTDKLPDSFVQPGLIRFKRIGISAEGYFEAPYLWVWIMAQQTTKNGDPLLKGWQLFDYREHSSVSDQRVPVGSQFWNNFEHFIATFRSLKSKVLCENELTTISEIHAGARLHLNDDFKFKNHHLKLECAIHHVNTNSATYDKRMDIECEGAYINVREDQSLNDNPNEVHQAKRWKTKSLSLNDYQSERNKSACDKDFFILFTTAKKCNFKLPMNSGIVDGLKWKEYFGPFAGRAHVYAIVGPLNINTATYTELMTIDGIGENRVITILKERPFKNLEDAKIKTGISEKVLKRLRFLEED
ncbi:putative crinkler family protein [Gigaspora margarita]|uniref:Putative crinkler family protein n=1 Tax=Gigaspora margarita TaxID=4874 RepID=A0A8H3X9S6_GIGMA|nr:putative crinkler family protein [Gigaspora margarita]